MPKTVTVSTAKQLLAAAKTAKSGDTILLTAGNYGDMNLNNLHPTGTVTIKSASGANDVVFSTLYIRNSSNLLVEHVDVCNPLPAGRSDVMQAAWIGDCKDISLVGMHFSGSLDGNHFNDGNGLAVAGSSHVTILDSTFEQFKVAVKMGTSSDVIFAGNTIRDVREGVNMSRLDGALFEKNFVTNVVGDASKGDHADSFQLHAGSTGGSSNDVVFRSNVIIAPAAQGIFINSTFAGKGIFQNNIVIENNYYEGNQRNAISVNQGNHVIVTGNTLRMSDGGTYAPGIVVNQSSDVQVSKNITPLIIQRTEVASTNISYADNIDVWDPQRRVGVPVASVFSTPLSHGNIDFSTLNASGSASVNVAGIGFRAVDGIGNLAGADAAMLANYLPKFEGLFTAHYFG